MHKAEKDLGSCQSFPEVRDDRVRPGTEAVGIGFVEKCGTTHVVGWKEYELGML
jgi:hypothetical protein